MYILWSTYRNWSCPYSDKFWSDFCSFVRDHIMPSFQLCFENVLFVFFTYDMSFHKEYYLINLLLLMAKFSIHKSKYGSYKPLFLILKSEIKQYLKSIYTLINKKAIKSIKICKHFHVFMQLLYCNYVSFFLYVFSPLTIVICWIQEIKKNQKRRPFFVFFFKNFLSLMKSV